MPAPDRIWLQDGGDYDSAHLASWHHVTWSTSPVDERDSQYVRTDICERVVAVLREAMHELRAEAQALILNEALLERRDNTLAPRLDTLDITDIAIINPLLDLLRRAETLVGRPPGGAVWLNALLDGAVTLGPSPRATANQNEIQP